MSFIKFGKKNRKQRKKKDGPLNRPLLPKANGSGQSKKKAKHAAAKAVLDIIIQGGAAGAGGPTSGGAPGAPPEL